MSVNQKIIHFFFNSADVVFNVAVVVVFFLFKFLFVLPTKHRPLPEDPKKKTKTS